MRKAFKSAVISIGLIAVFATTYGCVPIVVGAAAAGTVIYAKGTLAKNVDKSVKDVRGASLAAVKGLGLEVKSDTQELHTAKIKGIYEKGTSFTIIITALTEKASKISIRVGTFGNQENSLKILNAIEEKL